ncbi:MAG: hypothetical protein ABJA32_06780 [Ginsengibacter sp.]
MLKKVLAHFCFIKKCTNESFKDDPDFIMMYIVFAGTFMMGKATKISVLKYLEEMIIEECTQPL